MKESWIEKFNQPKDMIIKVLEKDFSDVKAGEVMLIATSKIMDEYINHVSKSYVTEVKTMRKDLAFTYQAYVTCPVTTGIFLRVVSGNHGACVFPALSATFNWFQSLKPACTSTSSSLLATFAPKVYPNPLTNQMTTEIQLEGYLEVFTIQGKKIYDNEFFDKHIINTSQWKTGSYLLKISGNNSCYFQKLYKL